MYYEIENSYGNPVRVYSDYNLEDVKEYLQGIKFRLKDFKVDESSDFDLENNDWVSDYYNEDLRWRFDDFDNEDSMGNCKYDKELIYSEILELHVDYYIALQRETIRNAWKNYTERFLEKEFEMLLERLAFEFEEELEENEDFDILEPLFEFDNPELIDILELNYEEFLYFNSFKDYQIDDFLFKDYDEWIEDIDIEDYLNDEYEEEEEEEEDEE